MLSSRPCGRQCPLMFPSAWSGIALVASRPNFYSFNQIPKLSTIKLSCDICLTYAISVQPNRICIINRLFLVPVSRNVNQMNKNRRGVEHRGTPWIHHIIITVYVPKHWTAVLQVSQYPFCRRGALNLPIKLNLKEWVWPKFTFKYKYIFSVSFLQGCPVTPDREEEPSLP